MSHRNGNGPKLELKLNLSPPRANRRVDLLGVVSPTSPPTSCLSSELNQEDKYSSSPEETTSMMLLGCPRCLMYIMLSEKDPKCPKCKSTVLLDIHPYNNDTAPTTTGGNNNNRTRSWAHRFNHPNFLLLLLVRSKMYGFPFLGKYRYGFGV